MRQTSKRQGQQGFTLLELIVVVAVIGILAAVAIPQYTAFREKSERAVIISDCKTIYRGFMMYFIENDEFPWASTNAPEKFDLASFAPLTDANLMGTDTSGMQRVINTLKKHLHDGKAEAYDSPDEPLGVNQTFYLVLPWAKDPSIKFVIAQSENVLVNGQPVDNGNWLDGVYMVKDGKIIHK